MRLKNFLDFILGRGKMDITRRVLRFFLFVSVITLILSSVLALGGILTTEDKMRAMGEHLGNSTRKNVTELVSEREKEHLKQLVHERVEFMDASMLDNVAGDTKILAQNMEDILSAPQNYLPKELIHPQSLEDGWALSLALTPSAVDNLENLRGKIAIAANIQNNLKNIALSYDVACSAYVAFEDGFDIVLDTDKSDMRAHYFDNPKPYREFNFKNRAWYTNAKEKNDLCFSGTMLNASSSDPIVVCSAPINVDGKFVGVSAMGFFVKDIAMFFANTSIGKSGFWFLMNNQGQVIVSAKNDGDLSVQKGFPDLRKTSGQSLAVIEEKIARGEKNLSLSLAAERMSRGEKGLMLITLNDEEYFLAFEPLRNVDWSFGALIKVSEVTEPVDAVALSIDRQTDDFIDETENFSLILLPIAAIMFIILFAAVSIFSKRLTKSFVKPINELSDGVREISSGNLDKKLEIHTGDEIEHLAICFNAMTEELKVYMANLEKETAEKERIATELDVAKDIQNGMLPKDFPNRADFELLAKTTPAKEVGGDFYDFYFLDETHLAITVADVSGKGIPAALFMVISKTILNNFAKTFYNQNGLEAVVEAANEQLCANNEAMMFVTAFIGVLDLKTGEFIFVNAGHNPPVIYHVEENHCDFLEVKKNFVLGPMDGFYLHGRRN